MRRYTNMKFVSCVSIGVSLRGEFVEFDKMDSFLKALIQPTLDVPPLGSLSVPK